MQHNTKQTAPWYWVLVVSIAVLFFGQLWSSRSVWASEVELVGYVTAMPSGSLIGPWTIHGVNFVSNSSTEFREDKGALVIGKCAEVEYVGSAQPFTATKIASKNADDCSSSGTATTTTTTTPSTGTPSTGTPSTGTPGATPLPPVEREIYGRVESMPASGFVGNWVVGGVSYNAPSSAEFKQRNGPLMVGACVKIHYTGSSVPFSVRELETKSSSDCSGSSTPGSTPSGTPTGTPGGTPGSTPSVTPGAEGELYGVLQSFPTGFVGNWNIGGMTFVATASTEFKQERGSFAVGTTVKVHFSIDANGINQAREIETKFANDDDGNDDDGDGSFEGAEGHAFAKIDSFPTELTGNWSIGGIAYSVTANTRLSQNDGQFALGAKVKVEYFLDKDGKRVARKIETTSDSGGATAPTRFKLFGFVKQMPINGLAGTWVIDNIAFVTDGNTQFEQNNGVLGVGAYVAVEYFIQDNRNQVHELETHVPPGAGANLNMGRLDDKGSALQAAAVQATIWVIDGVSYSIIPATNLNDVQSALTVGSTVLVNSYFAADGSRVATQVRGITIVGRVYLPMVRR